MNHLKRCKTSTSVFTCSFQAGDFMSFHFKQGHTASLTYRVQRSYGLGWEIRADHHDVPALSFQFSAMGRG